jgi:integrase
MARGIERLTALKIGKLRKAGLHADGGNLFLQLTIGTDGAIRKSWLFRYSRRGPGPKTETGRAKTRAMGLGPLHTIGLAEARLKARELRKLLLDRIDPLDHRNAERSKQAAEAAAAITFKEALDSYVRRHMQAWTPDNHHQFVSSIRRYVLPSLGNLPVASITTPHVVKVLEPIWTEKTVTAKRVRGRIESVLAWATVSGHRSGDNPAAWRNHLDKLLAAPESIRKVKHVPALAYGAMPEFMVQLRAKAGVPALALQFAVLTCVRTWDVLHAKRSDIDRAKRLWTIPELSKTGKVHSVPLSDAAIEVLDKAVTIATEIGGDVAASEVAFANDRNGRMLSENSMLAVLERMKLKGTMTTHGARSAFRTWALETTTYPHELCEICLGHSVGTKVTQAYMRGSALEKRRAIMADWADYLSGAHGAGNVVPINAKR